MTIFIEKIHVLVDLHGSTHVFQVSVISLPKELNELIYVKHKEKYLAPCKL